MKKREQKFSTEHFDAVLVTHEPEEKDLSYGVPGGVSVASIPENYLLIGPPGGQMARIEGVEIPLLFTLLNSVGRRCPVHGGYPPGVG